MELPDREAEGGAILEQHQDLGSVHGKTEKLQDIKVELLGGRCGFGWRSLEIKCQK